MKKRSFQDISKTSWENYSINFSDLLSRSESPCRKLTKRQHNDCVDFSLSQDVSITWSSSEDENKEENNNLSKRSLSDGRLSPVIVSSTKMSSAVHGSVLKSTPSGSPVLTQTRFSTVQKKSKRRPSLLPLSPITPGAWDNISFAHLSHISICANDESTFVQSEFDATPLAIPLDDSDEENVSEFHDNHTQEGETLTQDDIEAVTTQTSDQSPKHGERSETSLNLTISEDTSTLEDAMPTPHPTCSNRMCAGQKGSSWIESLVEKIDENNTNISATDCNGFLQTSCYDSSKKQKFIKGGLAEQLQHVLRQEKSSKVLFQHQAKENKDGQINRCCLKLRALSHHREGGLHILECQVAEKGNQVQIDDNFVTLLLQHEVVVEANINLRSQFIIHPPWKTVHLEQHLHPVLLCANHIRLEKDVVTNKGTSPPKTGSVETSSTHDINLNLACESLLQALENTSDQKNICLAATVQRIYQKMDNNMSRNLVTLLCQDAFGVFFELEVAQNLADCAPWSRSIEHGEGQRVLFQNIFVKGRTTKAQSPRLFSLISSIWNCEGCGLLQVQSSQSQSDSLDQPSQTNLQPPSFCYVLCAKCSSKPVFSSINHADTHHQSSLNRPNAEGSITCDILYVPVQNLCETTVQVSTNKKSRLSLVGKVIHHHSHNTASDKSTQVISPNLICVVTVKQQLLLVNIQNPDGIEHKIMKDNCLLLKDLYISNDGQMYFDTYSTMTHLNPGRHDCEIALKSVSNPQSCLQSILQLKNIEFCSYNDLCENTNIGSLVFVQGVIRKPVRPEETSTESSGQVTWTGFEELKPEVTIEVSPSIYLVAQLSNYTYWNLVTDGNFAQEHPLEDVLGSKFGPITCFVFAKKQEDNMTLFYAEEISCVTL